MAKKKAKAEDNVWTEYLKSIEKGPAKKEKKPNPIVKAFRNVFKKIKSRGKGWEKKELEKQVSISAKEGKKIFENEKPGKTAGLTKRAGPVNKQLSQTLKALAKDIKAKPGEKPAQLKIDTYLAKIEEKKKAEAFKRRPAAEVWKRPGKKEGFKKLPAAEVWKRPGKKEEFKKKPAGEVWKRPGKKEGFKKLPAADAWKRPGEKADEKKAGKKPVKKIKGKAATKKAVKWSEKIMAMPKKKADAQERQPLSKKISFLPSALAGESAETAVPAGKEGKKAKKIKLSKLKPAELETLLGGEPSLAKKSVSELKKLSTQEIRTALKKESIKRKARGWFGDALQHRRAALKGWQLRKKIVLHKLKKKARKKKLSVRERTRKRVLHSETRDYKVKLEDVEKQIRSLKRIGAKKKKESKALVKKIKKAGVKIPKSEIVGKPKKRSRINDMKDIAEIAAAMKSVADEVAAATIGREAQSMSKAQTFSIEDKIKSQQTLIKDLEMAFYKRRVGFSQFREKMFEYQSKLSQLRIQRKLLEKKKILKPKPAKPRPITGMITPEGVRKLGSLVERGPGFGDFLGKKTNNLIEKLGKQRPKGQPPKTGETPTPGKAAGAKPTAGKAVGEAKKTATGAKAAKETKPGETKADAEKAVAKKATAEKAQVAEAKIAKEKEAAEKAVAEKKAAEEKARAKKAAEEEKARVAEEKRAAREAKAAAKKAVARAKEATSKKAGAEKGPRPKVSERIIERPVFRSREERGFKKLPENFVNNIKKKVFEREGGKTPEKEAEKEKNEKKKLNKAIEQKALEGHLSKQSINKVEKKLDGLMKKYHIPANAISSRVNSMNGDKLVQDFQKLINLIENKKGKAAEELLKPFDVSIGLTSKKREKIIGREKEIKKIRIETTFDRVLSLVQVKGSIKLNDVANQLGMKKKEVQECAEILENSHLIKLIYPAIGSVRLVYPGYLKWKEEQKKAKKKAKKRKK